MRRRGTLAAALSLLVVSRLSIVDVGAAFSPRGLRPPSSFLTPFPSTARARWDRCRVRPVAPASCYSPATSTTSLRMASRSICAFEPSDFASPTGEWPYSDADVARADESDDAYFYETPRFVTHIDDGAISALTAFYEEEISAIAEEKNGGGVDVLDLCSSWISHLPTNGATAPLGRVAGVGMNEDELRANRQLTEHHVRDLNRNPSLDMFGDESFDVVCNVVSVDYLTKPLEIFRETHRVLRPGGRALISFSNRCFPTKAIAMWLQADDIDRLTIVGSYFHYSATWEGGIEALDAKPPPLKTPERPSVGEIFKNPNAAFAWASTAAAVAKSNMGDPMFVVRGVK